MGEEADAAAAVKAVVAGLSPVPSRVEPALKHAVSELAQVALAAAPTTELRARCGGVAPPAWVPPPSFFSRVSVRTLRPVVGSDSGAFPDLELVHPKLVALVRVEW